MTNKAGYYSAFVILCFCSKGFLVSHGQSFLSDLLNSRNMLKLTSFINRALIKAGDKIPECDIFAI